MTTEASGELETQLIQKSARVPFDDQPNYQARINQINPTLVRQYLENVKSGLVDDELRDEEIYEKLGLLWRVNGHSVPRNVALLFFSFKPEEFFRGAMIELARYSFEGDVLDEQTIKGPLDHQLRLAVNAVQSMIGTLRKKLDGQAGRGSFPLATPLAVGNTLVYPGLGTLMAVDARTGKHLWSGVEIDASFQHAVREVAIVGQ